MNEIASPKVSVVTIVYNGRHFIEGAIQSVLRQSFRDYEHIIIDDGSTDNTPVVIDEYANRDSRVRAIRQERAGIPKTRNYALRLSRGEYIAVLDADDLAFPTILKKQVAFLDKHPEIGLLGATELAFEVDTKRMWLVQHPSTDAQIRKSWVYRQISTHSATMMRREIALATGGYDEDLPRGSDPDLWIKIAERSRLANLSEPLVVRRFHKAQLTRKKKYAKISLNIKLKYRAIRRLKLPLYHYLYLIFPMLSFLPEEMKQFLRKILGHHKQVKSKDPNKHLKLSMDCLKDFQKIKDLL